MKCPSLFSPFSIAQIAKSIEMPMRILFISEKLREESGEGMLSSDECLCRIWRMRKKKSVSSVSGTLLVLGIPK